ncbi:50S ribosomal protein L37ae [Candidatus Woesearchaeota archaeon CG11_big_fil_rev_8_21_14_0_20_43_8]|nr:MAG: 50S ribosomal protein L37ae [Candidatus Woesearchaeota archaeon CG11_big_fil_rev_8_21_14_0_20_43_8]
MGKDGNLSEVSEMASKKKDIGSAKRYGARYGRLIRLKAGTVERQYKGKNKCPYCKKVGTKRKAVGIWHCPKCDTTFTGKAYSME